MNQKTKGVMCILCSAFFFSMMNVFVRLSGDVPSIQKSFFRNLVAALFALFILLRNNESFRWKAGNLKYLLLRSVTGTIGILGNFYAVDHLVLADATMLNKMSPFFGVIFSALFLKEKCKPTQALAILGAFIGSLFIIKPSFANADLFASLIGFAGGVAAGAAYTTVRYLGLRGERGPLIVFFFSTFSCLVVSPVLLFDYHPMTTNQLLLLLMAGLCAAGGQFSVTAAYKFAPARELSVYDYSQILFAAVTGFFVFNQVPDGYSFIGYTIIVGMAILMFIYNNRQHKKELAAQQN
ncbi:MAG: DMT family transporter [Firmicutes bacterium]|nr:DMT family transporter [Bacillota bacterium]